MNILNNIVNLTYGPQTNTIATQKNTQILKVKKSDPKFGVLTKDTYIYSITLVVDMKRNQKYQSFNKYNISD